VYNCNLRFEPTDSLLSSTGSHYQMEVLVIASASSFPKNNKTQHHLIFVSTKLGGTCGMFLCCPHTKKKTLRVCRQSPITEIHFHSSFSEVVGECMKGRYDSIVSLVGNRSLNFPFTSCSYSKRAMASNAPSSLLAIMSRNSPFGSSTCFTLFFLGGR